jgi:hypothetical protein
VLERLFGYLWEKKQEAIFSALLAAMTYAAFGHPSLDAFDLDIVYREPTLVEITNLRTRLEGVQLSVTAPGSATAMAFLNASTKMYVADRFPGTDDYQFGTPDKSASVLNEGRSIYLVLTPATGQTVHDVSIRITASDFDTNSGEVAWAKKARIAARATFALLALVGAYVLGARALARRRRRLPKARRDVRRLCDEASSNTVVRERIVADILHPKIDAWLERRARGVSAGAHAWVRVRAVKMALARGRGGEHTWDELIDECAETAFLDYGVHEAEA